MNLKELVYPFYYKSVFLPFLPVWQWFYCRIIAMKRFVNVVFIVSDLSMWRAEELYILLKKDPRFQVSICLFPFYSFSSDERINSIHLLSSYFSRKGLPFVDLTKKEQPDIFFRKELKPDVVFYPQPYYFLYDNGLDSIFLKSKLLCYIPYGFNTVDAPWLFNQKFHNFAWRLYYSSGAALDSARKYADNKGRNVRVVGNPLAEILSDSNWHVDIWKTQEKSKKRIIWAPHYSIEKGFFENNSFLALNEIMLYLAEKYKESIQFAFKPHPKLKTMLYQHPEWGKERTDSYYRIWESQENTQLETGGYIDLFKESDGMIHDSISFTVEYIYTQHPVFYFTNDIEQTSSCFNTPSKEALKAHYTGTDLESIEAFLNQVILEGNDPMASDRKRVYETYLISPNSKTATDNIYSDLLKSFGFHKM